MRALAAGYQKVIRTARTLIAGRTPPEKDAVFRLTAARVYAVPPSGRA
nr:hypothetical protein OG409_31940 [Streptomyces sp. NBC_00974]